MKLVRVIPIIIALIALFLAVWVSDDSQILSALLCYVFIRELITYKQNRNNPWLFG